MMSLNGLFNRGTKINSMHPLLFLCLFGSLTVNLVNPSSGCVEETNLFTSQSVVPSLVADWFLRPLQVKVMGRPKSCVGITGLLSKSDHPDNNFSARMQIYSIPQYTLG